jgi:hypothetical protein
MFVEMAAHGMNSTIAHGHLRLGFGQVVREGAGLYRGLGRQDREELTFLSTTLVALPDLAFGLGCDDGLGGFFFSGPSDLLSGSVLGCEASDPNFLLPKGSFFADTCAGVGRGKARLPLFVRHFGPTAS